jgi:hypothetical protein
MAAFARYPADVNEDDIINYSTAAGTAQYKETLKTFHPMKSTFFDLNKADLHSLIRVLTQNTKKRGLHQYFQIPTNTDGTGPIVDILVHPSAFTLQHLKAYQVEKLMVQNLDCDDQNNAMGYKALYSSMSIKARNVLDSCDPDYVVGGQPSMICLYRLIVQNSILDTNKTPTLARKRLHKMATILKEMHYNIKEFLQEVTDVIDVIVSHQQTVEIHDLIIQLFQGLKTVPDERFQRYLDIQEDEYNKGLFMDASGQALPYQLMALVKVEYQSLG